MNLEKKLHDIEVDLAFFCAIPIVGVLPGALRVALGSIQTIIALFAGVFFGMGFLMQVKGCDAPCKKATTHVVHGLGNIMAGLIEGMPLIGTISYLFRLRSRHFTGSATSSMCYLAYKEYGEKRRLWIAQNVDRHPDYKPSRKSKCSLPFLEV